MQECMIHYIQKLKWGKGESAMNMIRPCEVEGVCPYFSEGGDDCERFCGVGVIDNLEGDFSISECCEEDEKGESWV